MHTSRFLVAIEPRGYPFLIVIGFRGLVVKRKQSTNTEWTAREIKLLGSRPDVFGLMPKEEVRDLLPDLHGCP